MNPPSNMPDAVLPAVRNLVESLDADSDRIQGIADKLVQGVGASLDEDKKAITGLKVKLSGAVGRDLRKRTGPILSEIAQRMRSAVATSVDADQQTVDRYAAALGPSLEAALPQPLTVGGIPPAPTSPILFGGDPATLGYYPGSCVGPYGDPAGAPPFPIAANLVWVLQASGWFYCNRYYPTGTGGLEPPAPVPEPVPTPAPEPPPAPLPAPAPAPAPGPDECLRVACSPLPCDLPGVRVYVVPWLDPGDPAPSVLSECGVKLVRDGMGEDFPAAELAAAMRSLEALDAYLPPAPATIPRHVFGSDEGRSPGYIYRS